MDSHMDLMQLPVAERLECMEMLWESLLPHQPDSPIWHGRVLSERVTKIEKGEATFISGEELKQRLMR